MVEVYTKDNCGRCVMLKSWLQRNEINYKEYNISNDMRALDTLIELGHKSLPVLFKDEEFVSSGFDSKELEKELL